MIKLFLQTHAGLKTGSSLYKNTVLPLFQAADVNVECVGMGISSCQRKVTEKNQIHIDIFFLNTLLNQWLSIAVTIQTS